MESTKLPEPTLSSEHFSANLNFNLLLKRAQSKSGSGAGTPSSRAESVKSEFLVDSFLPQLPVVKEEFECDAPESLSAVLSDHLTEDEEKLLASSPTSSNNLSTLSLPSGIPYGTAIRTIGK